MGEIVERDFGRDGCRTARILRRIEALPPILKLSGSTPTAQRCLGYSRDEIRAELIRRGEGLHCMT
jgi:hypothetical protein